jgi:predicted TIM-barrel fold metal-dependent hydrolase
MFSTFFIARTTRDPDLERKLCRAYNDWVSSRAQPSAGRLRWVGVLPLLNMDKALAELEWAVRHGACAIHVRGVEDERMLNDPYFFPLYEEAARQNIAVCIHAGSGNLYIWDNLVRGRRELTYFATKVPVLAAFNILAVSDIPDRFPGLRFGFIEAAASWVPYMLRDLQQRSPRILDKAIKIDEHFLRDRGFFVACQADDDLPYVIDTIGDDSLVIGSDFGHADTSSELEALLQVRNDERLGQDSRAKILCDNARRLYNI